MLHLVRKFLGTERQCVILAGNADMAFQYRDEIEFYLRGFSASSIRVKLFNSDAFFPYRGSDFEQSRGEEANLLFSLSGEKGFIILTPDIFLRKFGYPIQRKEQSLRISVFDELDVSFLAEILGETGYRRCDMVSEQGEFAIRGGIIDIYSPVNEYPVRIELSGNRVETIRQFDPDTQTSVNAVSCAEIYPVEVEEGAAKHSLFDYMGNSHAIFYDDRDSIVRCAGLFIQRAHDMWSLMKEDEPGALPPSDFYITDGEFSSLLGKLEAAGNIVEFEERDEIKPAYDPVRTARKGEFSKLPHERLRELLDGNDSCPLFVVALQTEADINRFSAILTQQGTVHAVRRFGFLAGGLSGIVLTAGIIPETFIDRETGTMFISSFDLFGQKFHRRETGKAKGQHFVEVFKELNPGDLVVHKDYGIGRYMGLAELKVASGGESANTAGKKCSSRMDAVMQDFLLIEYRDGDKLYCPVYKLDLVQKYIGSSEVVLDKLGSRGWERKKASASEAAREMAEKLLRLYAEREMSIKEPFSAPDSLYREFEASFPYELTDDQEKAVEEILGDMVLPKCMDRLVCGDVGFGKTEVAVRAAFKAVEDGRQVAVLVPTTILAEQHFLTFSERFKDMPVVIESLSRLRTKAEQKEILRGLADGRIDIVIGTHRLLSGDITFKKLGLIITDEEHRFGVTQKEKFKEWKKDIDSISLTATPIPRTLNMSLSGIRDMSIISTPPRNRTAIKTSIIRFNRALIREGILRELNRGGQVFFLHNRVASIGKMRKILEEIVPEARIETAHGQMKPHDIEKVMLSFLKGDVNLLLCSAIIESGIDIPRANTIFINRADLFGISQLYQIRGRVGRSSEKAYAYLIVPERLNAEAVKRLNTFRKFGELGSGFILSMHDLEIRGAGNLLGKEQSGHILSIGFEMYSELLNDEVRRMRGEKIEEKVNTEIKVDIPAGIPEEYISDQKMRLYFYKKISAAEDEGRIAEIRTELSDRYGRIPALLENMLEIVRIKQFARLASIEKVEKGGRNLFLRCRDPEVTGRYLKDTERAWSIESGNVIKTALEEEGTEWLRSAVAILREIAGYVKSSKVIEVEDARYQ